MLTLPQELLSEQWRRLILEPLPRLDDRLVASRQLVLVVDGLDECEGFNDIRQILRLLPEAKNLETARLRVFVTSRPEMPILLGFNAVPTGEHQDFVLHNIAQPV